jgi:hypothetical protein
MVEILVVSGTVGGILMAMIICTWPTTQISSSIAVGEWLSSGQRFTTEVLVEDLDFLPMKTIPLEFLPVAGDYAKITTEEIPLETQG